MNRFWGKVAKGGPEECWEWTAARLKRTGYGCIAVKGKLVGAHRVSWELANGPIPEGGWICHRCDNRGCVNPNHLFLGSPKDNTRDMMQKKRNGHREDLSLGWRQVARVLHREGLTYVAIAAELNVTPAAIGMMIRGNSWKNDPPLEGGSGP